jgi:tetratricopeptide (TPR) repeat protein
VHYFDPHQPFVPPTPFDELYAGDLYQGEIAYADESLGRILAVLEEKNVADRTLVVVVGDHGEGLGEHDELTHSLLCYQTTVRVPLIMRVPGTEGGIRIDDNVGTVDLLPTIVDLVGLPKPDELQGRSLRPYTLPGSEPVTDSNRLYYSETLSPRLAHQWSEVRTLIDDRLKYIHSSKPELYDLRTDPNELINLATAQPEVVDAMRRQLEEFVREKSSSIAGDAAGEVDAETLKRLAALGYVGASEAPETTGLEEIYDQGVAPRDRAGDVSQWSTAKNFLFSRQFLEAREIAQDLVDVDPTNQLYLALLAIAQFNLGHTDQALATLERSPSLNSRALDLYLGIADELEARSEADRALRLVESVVSSFPSTDGFYALAGMHKRLGNPGEQRSALEAALELDPGFAPARVALAVDTARSGDLVSSEAELNQALRDGPLYPPAHFNLGKIYLDTGRASEAVASFDRARSLNRTYWNAYFGLVAAYAELGETRSADEVIQDLIDRQAPTSVIEQAGTFLEAE